MHRRRTVLVATTKRSDETLTRWTRTLAAAAALLAAAAAAAPAWGHARVVTTTPGESAVLASPPSRVTIRFDDTIRVLSGTVVIRNADKRSVVAGKPRSNGRVVTIPLRKLHDGDYTVRWQVLSNDGHTVEGVFAFAVGAGRAPPSAALSAGGGSPRARDVVSRWFFFTGLLVAVGVALFLPLAWWPALRVAGVEPEEGPLWGLAFAGFLLALGVATVVLDRRERAAAVHGGPGAPAGWYGDPDAVEVPLEELLSAEYAAERRGLIGAEASMELRPGSLPTGGGLVRYASEFALFGE